ncbi:MAG: extracellular solute-binding protein [Chloroflexota bacterium]
MSKEQKAFIMNRRRFMQSAAALGAGSALVAACGPAPSDGGGDAGGDAGGDGGDAGGDDNPLLGSNETNMQGKSLTLSLAVIAGWPPSQLPIEMFPTFAAHAKEKFGYDVDVQKTEAPFAALFQKVAPTLASKSQEYNLIISDSQWLGALSEPGWIIRADDVYELNPELDIEVYSSLVRETYQVYPDGSGQRWGFPQMPDTQGVFMRLDMLEDPAEQEAFEAAYGKPLPTTYEEFAEMTIQEYEEVFEHFHRPDEGMAGTAIMYSKEYDFFSCAYHPYVYATGGDIWDPATGDVVGVLNTPENAAQLEYFASLTKYQNEGASDFGIGSMIDQFTQGKVFSAFQWLAVGLFMIPEELEGKVIAVPHPKFEFPDGSRDVIGAMGGQPWVINSFNDDDHMRACIDFLKWWYTDETQAEFIANGGLPWSKAGIEAEGFEESSPYARAFKEMLGEGKSRDFWHLPEYAELLAIQQEAYNAYVAGQVDDPQHVLNYIAAKQQELLLDKGRTETPVPAELEGITLL